MLKIETLNGFNTPTKSYQGDAGWDLYSTEDKLLNPKEHFRFGLKFRIIGQPGKVYFTTERSSLAINHGIHVIGGVIDNGYRGEVSVVLYNGSNEAYQVKEGDKIAQLLILNVDDDPILFANDTTLPWPDLPTREENAHGSTGR